MMIFHVLVAIAGIIFTSIAYFGLSRWALHAAYTSAGLTLASGAYLVWAMPSAMLHVCLAGVAYLSIVSVGIVLARGRLARRAAIHR